MPDSTLYDAPSLSYFFIGTRIAIIKMRPIVLEQLKPKELLMIINRQIVVLIAILNLSAGIAAHAADDVGTTVKNSASDVSTTTKKSARWTKKQARKATGTDSTTQDLKDSVNDKKDDLNNSTTKMKNKANENK